MVVREVALNVAKHAQAEKVEVSLTSPAHGAVEITIADDGIGFDPDLVPKRRLGLQVSVVYRMWAIGGHAEIRSAPGEGTVVTLTWTPTRRTGRHRALGRPLSPFDRRIDVHISSIRQKLGTRDDGRSWIQTVRGMGYQLVAD